MRPTRHACFRRRCHFPAVRQRRVAAGVILVAVRVDDPSDRRCGQRSNRAEDVWRDFGRHRVDDQHSLRANADGRIAARRSDQHVDVSSDRQEVHAPCRCRRRRRGLCAAASLEQRRRVRPSSPSQATRGADSFRASLWRRWRGSRPQAWPSAAGGRFGAFETGGGGGGAAVGIDRILIMNSGYIVSAPPRSAREWHLVFRGPLGDERVGARQIVGDLRLRGDRLRRR